MLMGTHTTIKECDPIRKRSIKKAEVTASSFVLCIDKCTEALQHSKVYGFDR